MTAQENSLRCEFNKNKKLISRLLNQLSNGNGHKYRKVRGGVVTVEDYYDYLRQRNITITNLITDINS